MRLNKRPKILIHGLWDTAKIFNSISKKLDAYEIEYFTPTLIHDFGMISIIDLSEYLNELIIKKYGSKEEIDIVGFSMGGLIVRYWINKFNGYERTKKFISIGSPQKGTFTAQLIPSFPLKGISEMKIGSFFLTELSRYDYLLKDIECISFFTKWDLMVMPGWKAYLPFGKKYSLNVFKHKNLVKSPEAMNLIIQKIIN